MSEHYRVPKREVAASVALFGHPAAAVTIFLSDSAQNHHGAERPSDLFNGPGPFIPALDPAKGPVLFHRDSILAVTVAAEEEFGSNADRAEDLAYEASMSIEVEIAMQTGDLIHGTLTFIMPEGQRRLQDVVNQSEQFLTLRVENNARLINKRRIARISAAKNK